MEKSVASNDGAAVRRWNQRESRDLCRLSMLFFPAIEQQPAKWLHFYGSLAKDEVLRLTQIGDFVGALY